MTTFFVDSVNGADANNGLGPDASAGTNKPWKTIAKALGASGIASGDTVYLSPAGPFRENVTVAMTSATVTTSVIGDPGNAQGFKTSGGAAVAPGPIVWTDYLTNDKTAPANGNPLILAGRNFLSFQYIQFVAGQGNCVQATSATTKNISFTDCAFSATSFSNASGSALVFTATFATALNLTVDRCTFIWPMSGANVIYINSLPTGTGADYDANVLVTNCLFVCGGTNVIRVDGSGAGANKGGGVRVRNITTIGGNDVVFKCNDSANHSTSIPNTITNSVLSAGQGTCLAANASGQLTEDYNIIVAATPRSNVATGTHSISNGSYATMFHFGQERIWGMLQRIFGEPMAGSPLLGFGNDGNQTAYDGYNRPRPAGGGQAPAVSSPQSPATGWLDRGNTSAQGTSPAPPSGTHTWQGTGPWYQDFLLPVSAVSTTVAISDQFDGSYTGTKPQLLILANPAIGVSGQTVTDAGASGSWNTLSASPFTPTASGFVTVRIVSGDTSGVSVVEFADFAIT